jgi:hypothetical protein
MHYKILSTQTITADDPAALIQYPQGLSESTLIAYTFGPGRAVDVELRNTASGGGAYIIPEDSALEDNYSTPPFMFANAPQYLYAASSQALTLTIALVIP